MNPCPVLTESLYQFVAQELPPQQHEDVCRHLLCCPPCAALVESYQITIRLARQLPPVPMPDDCLCRLQAALSRLLGRGSDPAVG